MRNRGFAYFYILLFLFGGTFSACISTSNTLSKHGIEKRKYTKGYHIDFLHKDIRTALKHYRDVEPNNVSSSDGTEEIIHPPTNRFDPAQNGGSKRESRKKARTILKTLLAQVDSLQCGDKVIYKTGERVMAKVLSVDIDEITFKKCSNLTGPIYTVKKSDISSIEYINGEKEVFDATDADEYYVQEEYEQPSEVVDEKLALTSLLLGITSFVIPVVGLVTSIVAIALGVKALKRIRASNGRLKGEGKAITGIILGITYWAILIFVIAFLVAVLI